MTAAHDHHASKLDLSNRVALVTGGSRGIGRACALLLAERGATVAVNYNTSREAAEEVVKDIRSMGGRACAVAADVAERSQVERMFREVIDGLGRPDILIANAGTREDQLLIRMSDEEWDRVIDTNLRGVFLTTRAALRGMIRARWGRIIAISSVAGITGSPGQANYSAAKAGVIGFVYSVAREMGSRNITANVIAPGFIETSLIADVPESVRKLALSRMSIARFGTVDDVAEMVAFLASDAASYITGQVIRVDGGISY